MPFTGPLFSHFLQVVSPVRRPHNALKGRTGVAEPCRG